LGGVTGSATGLLGKRKKRNSLYFEENFAAHWDIGQPIPYAFDANLCKFYCKFFVGKRKKLSKK
jgi:hypothetical protein